MARSEYVLLTAARNEGAYLKNTIEAVAAQVLKPTEWIIVSDGSTDETEEIVNECATKDGYIRPLCVKGDTDRNFGSKAACINYAHTRLETQDYRFIGVLDADVTFAAIYYKEIMMRFDANPRLGVAAGTLYNRSRGRFKKVPRSNLFIPGPVQFFRRECFEEIEGYRRIPTGGIDTVAEVMARMHGWETQSFEDLEVYHHRETGTEGRSIWRASFNQGLSDYCLGYHALFFLLREMARTGTQRPLILGSVCKIVGFLSGMLQCRHFEVPPEFVEFLRREQLDRILAKCTRSLKGG